MLLSVWAGTMLLTGRCSFLCCHWQVKKTGGGSGHVPADGDRRSFVSLLSCHLVPFLVLLSVLAGVAPHHRRQRLSALYTSHWQQPIRLPPFACPSRRHLRTRPFPQPPPLACLWHLRITISIVLRFHLHRRRSRSRRLVTCHIWHSRHRRSRRLHLLPNLATPSQPLTPLDLLPY